MSEESIKIDSNIKSELVHSTISALCTSDSKVPEFVALASSISPLTPLTVTILTGGLTNYSYKVHAADKAVFAKVAFSHALWNPDFEGTYELTRTENEATMMSKFGELAPGCVSTLLHITDLSHPEVEGDMKLLVTSWAPNDEQLSNQFIDGVSDLRVARTLGDAVAALHSAPFEPSFNDGVREVMRDLMLGIRTKLESLSSSSPPPNIDRTVAFVSKLLDSPSTLFASAESDYERRECLVHSDIHGFNVLVEPKPDLSKLSAFGPSGTFTLVDWEMCYAGPVGRDLGIMCAFPIACSLAHAISGHPDGAYDCVRFVETYLDSYVDKRRDTEDEARVVEMYRNGLGWCGVFMSFMCLLDIHLEFLPLSATSKDMDIVRDSLGVITLKLLRLGYSPCTASLTLPELRAEFQSAYDDEIKYVQTTPEGRRPSRTRRSSMLRASGKVVSDAGNHVVASRTLKGKVQAVIAMQRLARGIGGLFSSTSKAQDEMEEIF